MLAEPGPVSEGDSLQLRAVDTVSRGRDGRTCATIEAASGDRVIERGSTER